ncbi:MAG TPA: PEP-CTERM sorting domain-containing protein [Oligoflexia bacterium]|nr:PEP-CTERM sorting domain-containing protein [Oligoflexia bacterium]
MNNWKLSLSLVCLLFFSVQSASAVTVNFRDRAYRAGDDDPAYSFVVDGIEVTLSASMGELEWDSSDGFGIDSRSYEDDEIEGAERLIVTFSQAVALSQILISDLFIEARHGHIYHELGSYSLNGGANVDFEANSWHGNLALTIPDTLVTEIVLSAPGILGSGCRRQDHEFSLAGLSFSGSAGPVEVPEPMTLLLLGSGVAGFAIRKRKLESF